MTHLRATDDATDEATLAAQNAKALQLAMSFLAAQQMGNNGAKDPAFAALAAAFNQSVMGGPTTEDNNNNNNTKV